MIKLAFSALLFVAAFAHSQATDATEEKLVQGLRATLDYMKVDPSSIRGFILRGQFSEEAVRAAARLAPIISSEDAPDKENFRLPPKYMWLRALSLQDPSVFIKLTKGPISHGNLDCGLGIEVTVAPNNSGKWIVPGARMTMC